MRDKSRLQKKIANSKTKAQKAQKMNGSEMKKVSITANKK